MLPRRRNNLPTYNKLRSAIQLLPVFPVTGARPLLPGGLKMSSWPLLDNRWSVTGCPHKVLFSDHSFSQFYAAFLINLYYQGRQSLVLRHVEVLLTLGEISLIQRVVGNLIQEEALWLYLEIAGILDLGLQNINGITFWCYFALPHPSQQTRNGSGKPEPCEVWNRTGRQLRRKYHSSINHFHLTFQILCSNLTLQTQLNSTYSSVDGAGNKAVGSKVTSKR